MLNVKVFPAITEAYRQDHGDNGLDHVCWFQDGAQAHQAHQARIVRDRLLHIFGENKLVALRTLVEWPPRSPDLTLLDFFVWGHLKGKVYYKLLTSMYKQQWRTRRI